jgi:hypothetical protein
MTTHEWTEFYSAAVLESDWSQLGELITAAEMAISGRLNEFAQDHGGTPEENQAIINALNSLKVLRADLASWRETNGSITQLGTGHRTDSI